MKHNAILVHDFTRSQIAKLTKRGIFLIRPADIPDYDAAFPFAQPLRGYEVNDNGTGRVWTRRQVVEAAR